MLINFREVKSSFVHLLLSTYLGYPRELRQSVCGKIVGYTTGKKLKPGPGAKVSALKPGGPLPSFSLKPGVSPGFTVKKGMSLGFQPETGCVSRVSR